MALPFALPNFNTYQAGFGSPLPLRQKELLLPPDPPVRDVEAEYAALDPTQRAWVDKQLQLREQPRGALGEIGAGLMRGVVGELPKLAGRALQAPANLMYDKPAAPGEDRGAFYHIGQRFIDAGKAQEVPYSTDETPGAHGRVVRDVAEGLSMAAPSIGTAVVGGLIGGPVGMAALPGIAFAGSSFTQTYEDGIKAGLTPEDAKIAAAKVAAIEGTGEAIAGRITGGAVTGKLGKNLLGKSYTVPEALAKMEKPQFMRQFAADLGKTAAGEISTEMGQGAGQAYVEQQAGISKTTPWEAASAAIGPTMALTGVLGGFGAHALRRQQRGNQAALDIVTKADEHSPRDVYFATKRLESQMEPLVGKEAAQEWRLDVIAKEHTKGMANRWADQQEADLRMQRAQPEIDAFVNGAPPPAPNQWLPANARPPEAPPEASDPSWGAAARWDERMQVDDMRVMIGAMETARKARWDAAAQQEKLTQARMQELAYLRTTAGQFADQYLTENPDSSPEDVRGAYENYLEQSAPKADPKAKSSGFNVDAATARIEAAKNEIKPAQGTAKALGLLPEKSVIETADGGTEYSISKQLRLKALQREFPKMPTTLHNQLAALNATELADAIQQVWHARGGVNGVANGKPMPDYVQKFPALFAELTKNTRKIEDLPGAAAEGTRLQGPQLTLTPTTAQTEEQRLDMQATAIREFVAENNRQPTPAEKAQITKRQGDLFAGPQPLTKGQSTAQSNARISNAARVAASMLKELENGNIETQSVRSEGQSTPVPEGQSSAGQGPTEAKGLLDTAAPPKTQAEAQQRKEAKVTDITREEIIARVEGDLASVNATPAAPASENASSREGEGVVGVAPAKTVAEVAPVTVTVTPTGQESSRTVAWGETPTTPSGWGDIAMQMSPDGTLTYDTPRKERTQTTVGDRLMREAKSERFTPAKYHVMVPEALQRKPVGWEKDKRRKISEANRYTFEIINYNPKAGRGTASVNTAWYESWVAAQRDSRLLDEKGNPTAVAKNALAALKWLESYEGADIHDRVLFRDDANMFAINSRASEAAAIAQKAINDAVTEEIKQISLDREAAIRKGLSGQEIETWTLERLKLINDVMALADQRAEAKNRATTQQNMSESAQQRAEERRLIEEFKRQYTAELKDIVRGAIEGDPTILALHAERPNYEPTDGLMTAVETAQLSNVLTELERNAPSTWVAYMAKLLRGLNLDVKIDKTDRVAHSPTGERVYAAYNHLTNSIRVYLGGGNAHTLVHEITHAATVGRIMEAKAAVRKPVSQLTSADKHAIASLRDLQDFMADMKKLDTKGRYAFTSEEEFVAEVMSNEQLQRWLDRTPYDNRSMWQRFVDWARELLGGSPYEGQNALQRALELSVPFLGDSRFGAAVGKTYAHSATAAAANTNSVGSALKSLWEAVTLKVESLANVSANVRKGLWYASSTFNMAQWVDKIPALRPLVMGMHQYMFADEEKILMRSSKQREFSTITTSLKLAFLKLPSAQRKTMDALLMGFAGDISTLNIDLSKNFDANKLANPALDVANKDYINRRHAEYMRVPQAIRQPFEESFRVFRKNFIQHTALVVQEVLRMNSVKSPWVDTYIELLNIKQPALEKGANPDPKYYYDAYSANLEKTIRLNMSALLERGIENDNLTADLRQVNEFFNAAVGNPYMHLGRSGEYFFEATVADTPGAWEAARNIATKANKIVGVPNKERHLFMRFATEAQRNAAEKAFRAMPDGYLVAETIKAGSLFESDTMGNMRGVPQFARKLSKFLRETADSETAKETSTIIMRFLMDYTPDSAPGKALAPRKDGGVPGFDATFTRNYAKRAEGMSSMVSTMYTAPLYDDAFDSLKKEVTLMRSAETEHKDGRVTGGDSSAATMGQEVLNEVSRRFANSLDAVESPIIDNVKAFGFNYYLAFSPAFWLTNIVQPYHLTLPYLGGRYGFAATAKEMGKSTSKAMKLVKAAIDSGWQEGRAKGGLPGALLGILDLNMDLASTGLSESEQGFLKRLIESGQLDTTQGHELGREADGEGRTRAVILKTLSSGSHYTEVVNRLTAGLTAFNLAQRHVTESKNGVEYSTQRGIEAVRATQFNYSDSNTGRMFGRHGVAGKLTPLLASFQQYSFQTMELLARMTMDAVLPQPKNATPEQLAAWKADRSAARRGLAGVMTTTSILAGTLGLPLANAIAAMVDRLLGDDDDPMDVKVAYRTWLADVFGKDVAEAISRGIPRAVLGFDTSTRMGMADLLPGTRFMADRRDLKSKLEAGAFSLMGPAVSAMRDTYLGMETALDGRVMDGLIQMLPLGVRGPLKALKMDEQGFSTSTGNKLPLDVTTWGEVVQTLGFTPAAKAEQSEVNFAYRQRDGLLKQRKTVLSNEAYRTIEAGDDPTDVLMRVAEFSNANPAYAINVTTGLQARAKARATAALSEAGIATLPRYMPQLDRYSYANVK